MAYLRLLLNAQQWFHAGWPLFSFIRLHRALVTLNSLIPLTFETMHWFPLLVHSLRISVQLIFKSPSSI